MDRRKFNKNLAVSQFLKDNSKIREELGAKLYDSYGPQNFAVYFYEKRPEDVAELVNQAMREADYPEQADWKTVAWELNVQNKVDFVEWVDIAAEKKYMNGEDIGDKFADFTKSDRDYQMYAEEWKKLLNIEVKLKENKYEWMERQGKAEQIGRLLASQFDPDYLGERLKSPELIEMTYNPTTDIFRDNADELGLTEKATTINTRFKVKPQLGIPFADFAKELSYMVKDGAELEKIFQTNSQVVNEIFLRKETLPYLAIEVEILDTIDEWEERNQILANPDRAEAVLTKKITDCFDPLLIGERLSTEAMLQRSDNACYQQIEEKLAEEGFPQGATPLNVDFDARAKCQLPYEDIAVILIELTGNNPEALNNMVHASPERFNAMWIAPEFLFTLDFDIILRQTVDEWIAENVGV